MGLKKWLRPNKKRAIKIMVRAKLKMLNLFLSDFKYLKARMLSKDLRIFILEIRVFLFRFVFEAVNDFLPEQAGKKI
jgi:hypothetical protein